MSENEKAITEEMTAAPMGEPDTTAEAEKGDAKHASPDNKPPEDTQDTKDTSSDFINDPNIQTYIKKEISEGIKKALKGATPKANLTEPTEEQRKIFHRMTYKERNNLFLSNPTVYNQLAQMQKGK